MLKKIKKILICLFNIFPIDKKLIVFESNVDLSDSTYALYLYLKKYYLNYKLVWAVSKNNIKSVKQLNVKCFSYDNKIITLYYLTKAKFFFYTHRALIDRKLKKNQYAYNIWHGSPCKKFNGSLIDNTYNNHCFVTQTKFTYEQYFKNYNISKINYLLINHLRNDFFEKNFDIETWKRANELLNIDSYKYNIVWMPTFRRDKANSDNFFDNFSINFLKEDFDEINLFLKKNNAQLIIKMHPMAVNSCNNIERDFSNISIYSSQELSSKKINIYSILGQSSALISDFSSVVFDYLLLNRPIGYVICDLEYYLQNKNEGFIYKNIENFFAGPIIADKKDLLIFFQSIFNKKDLYYEKRIDLNKKFNNEQIPGNICENFCSLIKLNKKD